MTLLLDTHTFLWWLSNPACLSLDARVAIEDPGNQVLVSTVVLWEIAIKRTIGKLSANLNLETATQAAGSSFCRSVWRISLPQRNFLCITATRSIAC